MDLLTCDGCELVRNRIRNLVTFPGSPGFPLSNAQGVSFYNPDPDQISGKVLIADNLFEGIHADLARAIVFHNWAADTTILRNTIRDVDQHGMLLLQNKGPVRINENLVAPGESSQSPFATRGMVIVDPIGGSLAIARNTIDVEDPQGAAMIIDMAEAFGAASGGLVIERNDVRMGGGASVGLLLANDISRASVAHNKFSGAADFAWGLSADLPDVVAGANTFTANNISSFNSAVSDGFLDTHTRNTLVVGNAGTVIDLGAGNRITGMTNLGQTGAGQQMRGTQDLRKELIWRQGLGGAPPPSRR